MSMELVCVLAVWFTNVLILISILAGIIILNRNMNKNREFDQMKFNFDYRPEENDFNIIETLIEDNLTMYRVLYLETIDKLYVTEKIQNEMFAYIFENVIKQLSPVHLQKLSYIYNLDRLNDIIVQKIKLYILNYTIEINGTPLS